MLVFATLIQGDRAPDVVINAAGDEASKHRRMVVFAPPTLYRQHWGRGVDFFIMTSCGFKWQTTRNDLRQRYANYPSVDSRKLHCSTSTTTTAVLYFVALMQGTARRTWRESWGRRRPGRSGSCADITPLRRRLTWGWSTRSCLSTS